MQSVTGGGFVSFPRAVVNSQPGTLGPWASSCRAASEKVTHRTSLRPHASWTNESTAASLDALCDDLDAPRAALEAKLGEIGYFYNAKENRFA